MGLKAAAAVLSTKHGSRLFLTENGLMTIGTDAASLGRAMHGADYVLLDGVVFETEYLRVPDTDTVPDDIVLEARNGATEIAFTRQEFDGAEDVGEGVYRLKSGALIRFLSTATVH